MNNVRFVQTRLQLLIGTLRCGVITASLTGVLGGIVFLAAQGGQAMSFHLFEGAQAQYASPLSVMYQAFAPIAGGLSARGLPITQLGIMMLLLTPITRRPLDRWLRPGAWSHLCNDHKHRSRHPHREPDTALMSLPQRSF
jgi:uncharacterized membrane protein